jgi:streptomycin 6-kinase
MQSFFSRAGAALSQYRSGDGAGEVAGQRLQTILERQKKEVAKDVLSRLSGSKPEEATEPLYDSSVYNSLGSDTEL